MAPPHATPTHPATRPFRLRYTAVTDVGRHRKENQDSGYASDRLLVVADGVGGAAYGDVASTTAVQLLRRLDAGDGPVAEGTTAAAEELLPALAGAVHRVHDRLAELVEHDDELEGTSTTVTAALFDGHQLGLAHVGDSRAYLLRAGQLQQLTRDHTFVQTLIDEGRISEAESRVHPHRNVILRAVDGVHDAEPDLFSLQVQAGDRVLLCSDGCSGAIPDDQIAALLGSGSVDSAALSLVQAALDGGTTDNVTVVRAEGGPADAADDAETSAATSTGPMLVGAAADQPRRGLRSPSRPRPATATAPTPEAGALALADRDSDSSSTPSSSPPGPGRVDEEERRYAPRPPRRHPGLRRLLIVLLPLAILAGVASAGYAWSQQQYYVSDDGSGVAIYQGVQVDVPGLQLSSVQEQADFPLDALPEGFRTQVEEGIVADDLADARRIVANLSDQLQDARG